MLEYWLTDTLYSLHVYACSCDQMYYYVYVCTCIDICIWTRMFTYVYIYMTIHLTQPWKLVSFVPKRLLLLIGRIYLNIGSTLLFYVPQHVVYFRWNAFKKFCRYHQCYCHCCFMRWLCMHVCFKCILWLCTLSEVTEWTCSYNILWIPDRSNTAYGQTSPHIIRCFISKINFANLRVKLFLSNLVVQFLLIHPLFLSPKKFYIKPTVD